MAEDVAEGEEEEVGVIAAVNMDTCHETAPPKEVVADIPAEDEVAEEVEEEEGGRRGLVEEEVK